MAGPACRNEGRVPPPLEKSFAPSDGFRAGRNLRHAARASRWCVLALRWRAESEYLPPRLRLFDAGDRSQSAVAPVLRMTLPHPSTSERIRFASPSVALPI